MGFQRLNNKGMVFKYGLFSLIAISMFVLASGIILGGWNDIYNTDAEDDFSAYNTLDNVSDTAGSTRVRLTPNDPQPSSDPEANTYTGVYGILTNIFSSFDLITGNDGMLTTISNRFGIPDYVRQGIVAFVMIGITFSLIAIIFRLARSSA